MAPCCTTDIQKPQDKCFCEHTQMVYNKQQSIPGRRDGDGGGGGLEFFSFVPLCPEQLCGLPFFSYLAVQSRLCMPI